MENEQIVDWLLEGDVSIQYQVHRDLLFVPREDLRNRIASEGWGQKYLSFQKESAKWIRNETGKVLSSRAPREVFEWMVSELTRHPRRNYLQVARGLWNWEAGEALHGLQTPTLIMVGEKDPWAPPRFSRLLHEAIPNSRLLIVDGQKHYVAMERPDLVNTAILDFLRDQRYF